MKFKHDKDIVRFKDLCDPLKYLANEIDYFFQIHGYEMLVTATWTTEEEDKQAKRKELAHRQFRGIDIRCRTLPKDFRNLLISRFTRNYVGWGAISKSTGRENLIQIHGDGDNEHFHVQLRIDWIKIKIPTEGKNAKLH
jgi:hypothetical protein